MNHSTDAIIEIEEEDSYSLSNEEEDEKKLKA